MAKTERIPHDRLADYLENFTKRFLRDGSPEAIDVEFVSPELGDQIATQGARLVGITYEEDTNRLEFELDSGDHRVIDAEEVWAIEEPDGFVSGLEVVHEDGSRDIASVKRVGLRRLDDRPES
jgi:hypothetical protein